MSHDGKSLLDAINDHLASDKLRLPVYSPAAAKLQSLTADPHCNVGDIEDLLMQDMGLSSQLLRIANSSFYGGLSKVASVDTAIQRLGLKQVVELAILCSQRDQFRSNDLLVKGYVDRLWRHSVAAAYGARWIAQRCGFGEQASEAFFAALFHDIGTLLLLQVMEQVRATNGAQHMPEALVIEVIDALHAEQGARLLETWQLPEAYATVARHHHSTEIESAGALGVTVRLADLACAKLGYTLCSRPKGAVAASPEATYLGLSEIALAELEIYLEGDVAPLAA